MASATSLRGLNSTNAATLKPLSTEVRRRGTLVVLLAALVLLAWTAPSVGALVIPPSPGTPSIAGPGPHAAPGGVAPPAAIPSPVPSSTARTPNPPSSPLSLPMGGARPTNFRVPGATPQSWGSRTPPGWEYALNSISHAQAPASPTPQNGAPGSYQQWLDNWCNGIWPDVKGQSAYAADCYGHDEPGIQFYSNLPGSGGNVTWNVTLPTSRSPTQNQSDLYSAIWFGLTLSVPSNAWMNQCFLELQFYPDSSWYAPGPFDLNYTVYGNWVGAAVAWQIQASTGAENPCFYEPLYLNGNPGGAFLNMTQGDQIAVTMTGWAGSAAGEQIQVNDLTNGQSSSVALFNQSCASAPSASVPACGGNYPLDPAYATNSYENGLQWTPGGEYPVVYAFEIGHAGNPAFPNNNLFGGCNPGSPGAGFGGTPCPSYDPGSWTNDTVSPWQFQVPTFFNAATSVRAAQVAFTDPQGGVALVNGANVFGAFPWYGACSGQIGTAFCSYPWYSYYCGTHTFEFGATDYPGVSADFGQYYQYQSYPEGNGAGWLYYPPANFSIPTCGGPSYGVDVGSTGSGTMNFLSQDYGSPLTNLSGLGPGEYSISALAASGSFFTGWATAGGVSVADASSAYTSLDVAGNGAVWAEFGSSPTPVTVTWALKGAGGGGWISVGNGSLFNAAPLLGTFSNGQTSVLPPALYGVEAYPPMGYNFTNWTVSSGTSTIAAPTFPWSVLNLDGASSSVTVTANFVSSSTATGVIIVGIGDGRVTFNGTNVPYYGIFQESYGVYYMPVGSYLATVTPASGWAFSQWYYGGSAVMNGFFDQQTYFNLEGLLAGPSGPYSELEAVFYQISPSPVNVTVTVGTGTGDAVSFEGSTPVTSQTLSLTPGSTYQFYAVPGSDQSLFSWAAAPANSASISSPFSGSTSVTIYGGVTLYANFTSAVGETVGFVNWPRDGGSIVFNFQDYAGATSNSSVPDGTYNIYAAPNYGYTFIRFETFGPVYVSGNFAIVYGNNSYIDAVFGPTGTPPPPQYAVTFVTTTPGAISANIGGTVLSNGETVLLTPGTVSLQAAGPGSSAAVEWTSTYFLGVGNPASANTTLSVYGPGTVYAILSGVVGPTTVSAPIVELGASVTFSTAITGYTGAGTVTWNGLPAGCASSALVFTCTPSAPGTYTVNVTGTFPGGISATTDSVVLQVVVRPGVSVALFPRVVDVATYTSIEVTGAGGEGPLSLSVTGLPAGCSVTGFGITTCLPLVSGSYAINATIRDALGASASDTATLTVNPILQVSAVTAQPAQLTLGGTVTLTTNLSGGTAPFTYRYLDLPAGCTSASSPTLSCTPTVPGTYEVHVGVIDGANGIAVGFSTIVVNPVPQIAAFTVSSASVTPGESVTFHVATVGGTLPATLSYSGLPPGCASSTAASFTCAPTQLGSYTVRVTLEDADHVTANATVTLTVATAPSTPTTTGASGMNGTLEALALAALIVAIVALLAAIVLGMRKGGPGGASTPPPAAVKSWKEDEPTPPGPGGAR